MLTAHTVETAYERGWSTLRNGELLAAAEQEGFDLFVTTDLNLKYQQNLEARRIAIVVLSTTSAWVSYLEDEGFSVTSIDSDDMDSIKTNLGLPSKNLASCHTATIDGFLVEGHVATSDIIKLLRERPQDIKGLTAPGMPAMSPGMGSLDPKDYDVLSFTATGETSIYSSY